MQATLERLRSRREELDGEGGFTLIELLIVIVILAILAAIVVFAVQNLSSSSAKASCESDVQTVDHALQAYVAQTGLQPATGAISSTEVLMESGQTGVNGDTVGPWLHNVPVNGNHYEVSVYNDGTNAYAAVTAPAGAFAVASSTVYEPNGTAAAAVGGASPTPAIVTTTKDACAAVTS